MPLECTTLQRQLDQADELLSAWIKKLDEKGLEPKQRRRDPKWRALNSSRKQIEARLKRAEQIVALDEELKRRSAEPVVEKPKKKGPKKGKADKMDKGEKAEKQSKDKAKSKPKEKSKKK